jgi:hypothetical protein
MLEAGMLSQPDDPASEGGSPAALVAGPPLLQRIAVVVNGNAKNVTAEVISPRCW